MPKVIPICPTCNQPARQSETKYGIRHDCCGLWSWEGKPLVDRETHEARKSAHASFDELWQGGLFKRGVAYRLLAVAMNMSSKDCHISMMSKEDARRVVDLAPKIRVAARPIKMTRKSNFIGLNPW